MELLAEMIDHIVAATYQGLPIEAVTSSKRFILDTMGAALAGSSATGCAAVAARLSTWGGAPESTIWAFGHRLPAPLAAFANGMMAHAREYDDVFERAPMHAFSSLLPAALAVGEAEGRTGQDLLTAVTVAADVQCRLALAYPLQHVWHPSAVRGFIGAAVAAGKMLGLNAEGIRHTLGLAFQQMSGSRQALLERALAKRMQAGFSARAGVFAAYLAHAGLTGPQDILDGVYGLARAFGHGVGSAERATADLGRWYEGLNLSMKPFPCHRTTHAAVEAALHMVAAEPIPPEEIQEVLVRAPHHTVEVSGKPFRLGKTPQVDAQISIPYTVAAALLRRRIGLSDFEESAVKDPHVLALAAKVHVAAEPGNGEWTPVEVSVQCRGGTRRVHRVDKLLGTPERPLGESELIAKVRDCARFAATSLSEERVDTLIRTVGRLEEVTALAALTSLMV